MYIYTDLFTPRATGISAEQPTFAPNGKALNQPKSHPVSRTVWKCGVTSNGRLIGSALRKFQTKNP